jgi:hypothetical protein
MSEKQNENEEKNQRSEHRYRSVSHSGFNTGNDWIIEPITIYYGIQLKPSL